jgi:hypothetical protein
MDQNYPNYNIMLQVDQGDLDLTEDALNSKLESKLVAIFTDN